MGLISNERNMRRQGYGTDSSSTLHELSRPDAPALFPLPVTLISISAQQITLTVNLSKHASSDTKENSL